MKWSIPEKVIARGRQYSQEGRVLSVISDQEENVWHAEVLGSELYMVDLDGTAEEIDYCRCPYWEEHKYYKHAVAVELCLRSKNLSRIMKKDQPTLEPVKVTSEGEIIAKGFSRLKTQNNPQAVQPLIIEYQVETIETNQYHPELSILTLYLRIGSLASPKKTYIAKNVYGFLQAYTEKETYIVDKQYQFRLDKRALQKEDQKILMYFARSAQAHQLLGTNGLQVEGKLDKRYLLLPVEQARFLLEQMNQIIRSHLQVNEQNDRGIQFSDQNKPLSFKVEKSGEDYLLQALNDFDFFFMHYQWGVIQETFYSLAKYQQTVYQTWKQLIRQLERPEVVFKKKELPSLFKEIIPLLSEIGDVAITPAVEGEVADIPVESIFFFQKAKGEIQARVDFVYGEVIYSADPKHEVPTEQAFQVLRDTIEEKRVLDLFRMHRYQKNRTGYERPLPSGEELHAFFRTELSVFRQFGEVRLRRKLRELYLDAYKHQSKIEVTKTGSWLGTRFDTTGIKEQEIDHVLRSLLRNDAFHTLKNGQVLSSDSEEFQQTSQVL